MSFILDALKKSESDRQRQSGPSLFEVKVAPPRRTLPIWAIAIAVLLGINAIVVSWMLLRRGPAPQPAAAAASSPPSAATQTAGNAAQMPSGGTIPVAVNAASGANAAAAPGHDVRSARPPFASARSPDSAPAPGAAVGAASAGDAPAAASSASPAAQGAGALPAAASAAAGAERRAAEASSGGNANPSDYAPAVEPAAAQGSGSGAAGDLPLYQQIVTSADLPALHLDLHVFASRPKDRFVMINMQRLGEGDSLPDGVQVQAIRPDGVVLSYRGTRFLLPRD